MGTVEEVREKREMKKKIIVLSGSPKKDGNTAHLVKWFTDGAREKEAQVEVIEMATLKFKILGCVACRSCQNEDRYGCVVDDEVSEVLQKVVEANVIVMATPLYFFAPSTQIKLIFDRMFSLYKWNNEDGTMRTPLKGKTFALIASAYEDVGLDALEKPFELTAEYTGMNFESLLIPDAGVSGEIKKRLEIKEQAIAFGKKIA